MVIKKIVGFMIVMDKDENDLLRDYSKKPEPMIVHVRHQEGNDWAEAYSRSDAIRGYDEEITIFESEDYANYACDILNALCTKENIFHKGEHYSVKPVKVTYSV